MWFKFHGAKTPFIMRKKITVESLPGTSVGTMKARVVRSSWFIQGFIVDNMSCVITASEFVLLCY